MEDSRMEKILQNEKSEAHLTSAAAFVEGGIQESCDDACSICLEAFCESDPSTVTTCKHEFHLQCILEWCQRSSQCPMCWQPISLKDPTGQELLEGIEHERSFRTNRPRNATIFHHPALGDFELQHLPVGATDAELEERIIQHLAAAAAMGRTRHISRREGQRNRLSSQGRPHFVVFSTHPSGPTSGSGASSPVDTDGGDLVPDVTPSSPPFPVRDSMLIAPTNSTEEDQGFSTPTRSSSSPVNSRGSPSSNRRSASNSSSPGQDQGGPSDLQSLSESVKSRFNAVSMRCKESITKSTRGWKERLFSQKPSMADISSEVRKEVTAGIATVSRMMERLEARESKGTASSSSSSSVVSSSSSSDNVPVPTTPDNVSNPETDKGNQQRGETTAPNHHPTSSCATSSCATSSCSTET